MRWLLIFMLVVVGTGCSAQARYGNEIRYAPSYRSYVLAAPEATDDPDPDDGGIVLRDPITKRKLRCRQDLERWLEPYRQKTLDDVHDEHWTIASIIIMAPATTVAALATDAFELSFGVAMLPYGLARSEDGLSIYERGVEAFAREDWETAARLMDLAMVKDAFGVGLASYYAGIAYANMGRTEHARVALTAFVERSLVQEVTAYRNAERWLDYLDSPIPECRSQEPVAVVW